MTVEYLIIIIAFLSLCQNKRRRPAALIFALFTSWHDMFMSGLNGISYYASAAGFDLAIIMLTANLIKMPKLTVDLHRICGISIALNFYGWIMWMLYLSPFSYNMAFAMLYIWTIIVLIKDEGVYNGNYRLDQWAHRFRWNYCQSRP